HVDVAHRTHIAGGEAESLLLPELLLAQELRLRRTELEPFAFLHLFRAVAINERQNGCGESFLHLLIFAGAACRARSRQPALVDKFPERLCIPTIRKAQRIIEALRSWAVLVGELPELGMVGKALPLIGKATDDQSCHVLAELQRNERRPLSGSILLAPHHRHVEHVLLPAGEGGTGCACTGWPVRESSKKASAPTCAPNPVPRAVPLILCRPATAIPSI